MNSFLLAGLVAGALCALICVTFDAAAKKVPNLADTVEILISAIGVSGGTKIFVFVLTGKLSAALKASNGALTEEDAAYFLIGALALIWVSLQVILRQLYRSWLVFQARPIPHPPGSGLQGSHSDSDGARTGPPGSDSLPPGGPMLLQLAEGPLGTLQIDCALHRWYSFCVETICGSQHRIP